MTPFKIDEDSGVPAQDQILARVNREADIAWGRSNELPLKENVKYLESIGRRFMLRKEEVIHLL